MHLISAGDQHFQSKEEITLNLPNDWYLVTYSYNYFANEDNSDLRVLPFNNSNKKISSKKYQEEILPTPSEWDFSKGDYRIQETGSTNQQYAYNDRLKIRVIKYAIYPAVILSLLFTFAVLSTIVGT
ncbi:MAG: hypothetical protein GY936_07850 [Ignavibacteriae bacterium]|nr:hypothetical protein [Ignavibacteriota bacterium]